MNCSPLLHVSKNDKCIWDLKFKLAWIYSFAANYDTLKKHYTNTNAQRLIEFYNLPIDVETKIRKGLNPDEREDIFSSSIDEDNIPFSDNEAIPVDLDQPRFASNSEVPTNNEFQTADTDSGQVKVRSKRAADGGEHMEGHYRGNDVNGGQRNWQGMRRQRKKPCGLVRMYINFKEIGLRNIITPAGFEAGRCVGRCMFPMHKLIPTNNHAIIQALAHNKEKTNRIRTNSRPFPPPISEPCCVPDKLNSLSIMYYDEGNTAVLRTFTDIVADTCACRWTLSLHDFRHTVIFDM